jgi:hypothetical protein
MSSLLNVAAIDPLAGLSILESAHDEQARELFVDDVVRVFAGVEVVVRAARHRRCTPERLTGANLRHSARIAV